MSTAKKGKYLTLGCSYASLQGVSYTKGLSMRKIEMIGRKFGDWIVLEEVEKRNNKRAFLCQCACSKQYVVMGDNLRNGTSEQCMSCSSKIKGGKHKTHGMTNTKVFDLWHSIKQRCNYPKHRSYKNYGAKGIRICERWAQSFEAFYEDMGDPPSLTHQIDRIDSKGNYEPGNCGWVTPKEQQNNKSNNVNLTFLGVTQSVAMWADKLGVNPTTLHWRISAGWSDAAVVSTPVGPNIDTEEFIEQAFEETENIKNTKLSPVPIKKKAVSNNR